MKADYIIRGGRLFDPDQQIDFVGDIAVKSGKIIEIGPEISKDAGHVLDASGCLVLPGLIDIHAHIYEDGVWNGMPADLAGIPLGVTAFLDAGSSGVSNYRDLIAKCRANKTHCRIMLNVSACGIIMPLQFSEPIDPALWNIALFDEAFREYGEMITGLKLRMNKAVVKDLGLEPLKKSVELAERYGTRVIVHVTDAAVSMSALADCLRGGDVFCHVFHGTGNTILNPDGTIEEGILRARERGVLFDVGSGRGNFSLAVAKQALSQGFLPDTISSDVTLQNWNNPIAGNLIYIMSKFLALGMSLEDVVSRVPSAPAKQFGVSGLGTLATGTPADVSVIKLENKTLSFTDRFDNQVEGKQLFVPKATMIGGQLLYRSADTLLLS